jgi:sugar-specific transcriptional regulator TrmB
MSDSADNIKHMLHPFGVEEIESDIYIHLLEKGYLSALSLSRSLGIPRTKVYRILDKLIDKGLVQQRLYDSGMKFGATDPSKFKQLVVEKLHTAEALKESLPDLLNKLENIASRRKDKTKVLYYQGAEGLKQISYNSLRAKGELLTYEVANDMSDFVPEAFAEDLRRQFVKNKIHIKQLTWNTHFAPYTKVTELITKYWDVRSINPESLTMKSEVLIYNDVYVMYNPVGSELFGVEIYNADFADMQRQLFYMVWNNARKMKIIGSHGEALLEK